LGLSAAFSRRIIVPAEARVSKPIVLHIRRLVVACRSLPPPPPLRCDVSPNDVVKFVVMDKDLHKEDDLMCSATVKGRQLLTRVCAPAAASVRWRSCGDDWVCRSGWSSSLTQIHPYPVMILTIFKNIF